MRGNILTYIALSQDGELRYADGAHGCYNGDISGIRWVTGDYPLGEATCCGYDYTYDSLDRLQEAAYVNAGIEGTGLTGQSSSASSKGSVQFRYDANGNITSLKRYGNSRYGAIEQTTHYYPYGGLMYLSTEHGFQKYKYNAKELDRTHGLDWYDYEARQYDPVIARFTSMDPLCEKYYNISPYAYCAGNPVNIVDPDGRDGVRIIDDANKSITIKATYFVRTGEKPFRCGNKICTLSGYSNKDIENMNHMPSKDKFQSVNVCF